MPSTVLRLLQDKGSVQQLGGPAHQHRKALFLRILMDDEQSLERLVATFRRQFLESVPHWSRVGAVQLGRELDLVLLRTAIMWTHAPIDSDFIEDDASLLSDMIEHAGHFRLATFTTLFRRSRLERRLRMAFRAIRREKLTPMPGSPGPSERRRCASHGPDEFRPARHLRMSAENYAFIPQGAGVAARGHRCPGEMATVEVVKEAVRLLIGAIDYEVPIQDLAVPLTTVPTGPHDGFIISGVRLRDLSAA